MNLLRWLFSGGRKKTPIKHEIPGAPGVTPSSRRLTVDEAEIANVAEIARRVDGSLNSRSPDGRYTVGWLSRSPWGDERPGIWVLVKHDKIVTQGHMHRPADGKVANDGTVILNEGEDIGTLNGAFYAFRVDGSLIMKCAFNANLFNNGISSDGSLAVCHTCNSGDENDSSILVVFDLNIGKEIARWRPESGWPNSYEFPGNGTVLLDYRHGVYAYTLDGEFLDRERWRDDSLERGEVFLAESLLKGASDNPPPELMVKILGCADVALASSDTRFHPLALKLRGICLEARGDVTEALDCYDRALAANPKIGVKRRADRIRKRLTT